MAKTKTKIKAETLSAIQAWAEKTGQRREELKARAEQLGLQRYPAPTSRVWVEPGYVLGTLPERFFVEEYLGEEEPRLVEYRLHFPIENLKQLTAALEAVDMFYSGVEDPIHCGKHSTIGLIEFLTNLTN